MSRRISGETSAIRPARMKVIAGVGGISLIAMNSLTGCSSGASPQEQEAARCEPTAIAEVKLTVDDKESLANGTASQSLIESIKGLDGEGIFRITAFSSAVKTEIERDWYIAVEAENILAPNKQLQIEQVVGRDIPFAELGIRSFRVADGCEVPILPAPSFQGPSVAEILPAPN